MIKVRSGPDFASASRLRFAVAALQEGALQLLFAYRQAPSIELKEALLHLTVTLRQATQQLARE